MTAASSHSIVHREGPQGARRRLGRAALAALAGLAAFVRTAAMAQVGTRLERIELQPQPGEQLEVRLVLDGPARSRWRSRSTTRRVSRWTCRAPRSRSNRAGSTSRRVASTRSSPRRPRAARGSCSTSTSCSLPDAGRRQHGLRDARPGRVALDRPAPTAQAASTAVAPSSGASIEKIDFRRGTDGAGRVLVRLSDPKVQASLKQEGGRIVVDLPRRRWPTSRCAATTSSISPRPVNSST